MIGLKQYINEQVELENLLIEMSEEDFDSLLETLDHKELEIVEGIFGAIAKGVGAVAKGAGKLAAKVADRFSGGASNSTVQQTFNFKFTKLYTKKNF